MNTKRHTTIGAVSNIVLLALTGVTLTGGSTLGMFVTIISIVTQATIYC